MVNKGIATAIAGGIGILIAGIFIFSSAPVLPSLPGQMEHGGGAVPSPTVQQDVVFSMNSLKIKQIDQESASIEVAFDLLNPNRHTLVMEEIQYELVADGVVLTKSSIGERLEGVITGTGQTYYLVSNVPLTLKDTVQIKKTKSLAEVWDSLVGNDVDWRIRGVYVITDPLRAGGQEKDFDFTLQ